MNSILEVVGVLSAMGGLFVLGWSLYSKGVKLTESKGN